MMQDKDLGRPGGLSSDDGAASVSTLRALIPDARDALEMIADPFTLPAPENQSTRKWHCQHQEMLAAASEVARAALGTDVVGNAGLIFRPCPFCAGRADFVVDCASDGRMTYTVFCDGCHASAATEFSRHGARRNWNRRCIAQDTLP